MSWQKEIRPTRENSSLPLYDNAPEAAAEPEPLSRREQRRLRRRTARNFSEVAQVASADDLENETKDGQDDANTTAETIGESSKDSPSDAPVASSSNPKTSSPEDEDCDKEADKGEETLDYARMNMLTFEQIRTVLQPQLASTPKAQATTTRTGTTMPKYSTA
ncbi:hypothetical protein LRP88_06661 [Fusarium phalaenopsidis]